MKNFKNKKIYIIYLFVIPLTNRIFEIPLANSENCLEPKSVFENFPWFANIGVFVMASNVYLHFFCQNRLCFQAIPGIA